MGKSKKLRSRVRKLQQPDVKLERLLADEPSMIWISATPLLKHPSLRGGLGLSSFRTKSSATTSKPRGKTRYRLEWSIFSNIRVWFGSAKGVLPVISSY